VEKLKVKETQSPVLSGFFNKKNFGKYEMLRLGTSDFE
jgi:hypothetical protein